MLSTRLSRRYQPYNKIMKNSNNNNMDKSIKKMEQPTQQHEQQQQQEDYLMEDSLFGPISTSSSNTTNFDFTYISPPTETSLLLEDDQVFEEFDDFINSPSPARYLSSPPPSPALSPSTSDDDDLDFNDFPLFP